VGFRGEWYFVLAKYLLQYLSQLVVNNEEKPTVARFSRKNLGIVGAALPAALEITPAGEHMVETILVTFIYIEKLRKDRE
jgi:hypothetical protein